MDEDIKNSYDVWRLHPERTERWIQEGEVPLVEVQGSSYDCGYQLGELWRDIAKPDAQRQSIVQMLGNWLDAASDVKKLMEKYAPHLVDLRHGFAKGTGITREDYTRGRESGLCREAGRETGGCTSFGIHPDATVDGIPISGQNKDTIEASAGRYIILKIKQKDAPVLLTLTYPGDFLGYGMCSTGFSVFRNNLATEPCDRGIPWAVFAEIFLHSKATLGVVMEEALRYGISGAANFTMSDCSGRSAAFEITKGGVGIVEGQESIVVHANHVHSRNLICHSNDTREYRARSLFRQRRLTELILSEYGRLTPQLVFKCLSDHHNSPYGICRHEDNPAGSKTTTSIVAQPTMGKLFVTRGNPCMNWAKCYTVD